MQFIIADSLSRLALSIHVLPVHVLEQANYHVLPVHVLEQANYL
jgi:hypothetical protein